MTNEYRFIGSGKVDRSGAGSPKITLLTEADNIINNPNNIAWFSYGSIVFVVPANEVTTKRRFKHD